MSSNEAPTETGLSRGSRRWNCTRLRTSRCSLCLTRRRGCH